MPEVKTAEQQYDPQEILNVNVGVLGHVDSGKTSLVKALSTLLSTAALDKSKESRERGMTLDLGFSCFFLDLPEHLQQHFPDKKKLQITLVDCPGHASLIRTIIGGAQIIDMVLLIVDAVKGWQAQTTECLVLAQLTSPHLLVALNKADMFEPNEREKQLEAAKSKVRQRLIGTRFADAPMVGVAACVGGEKAAANAEETKSSVLHETYQMDLLVDLLKAKLPPPRRSVTNEAKEQPFYFSVDHCFPIRGRGTVLTGTVLSGFAAVNDGIEFPSLGMDRKIKSIQMFKRQVQHIQQGDRAGICVSNLDAKLLERGIVAAPGAVPLWKGAIALVRKVPYYTSGKLMCNSKFHISVGHTTVMATLTFWGARELAHQAAEAKKDASSNKLMSSWLGGDADLAGLPKIPFDFQQDFVFQESLLEALDTSPGNPQETLLHWALLDFQTPVYCPAHSLVIGSRLDVAVDTDGGASSCRLAFSGRLIERVEPSTAMTQIRLYTEKQKVGVVSKLGDPHKRFDDQKVVCYEVFGDDLFKKETNMKLFIGMKMETEQGDIGEIKSSYGTSGKFRVYFPGGTEVQEGEPLYLRFKRFMHDPTKSMQQSTVLPPSRPGARLEVEKPKKEANKKKPREKGVNLIGEVASIKGDVLENGKHSMAIVSGFFAPEINIKEKVGTKVFIPSTQEEGSIVGAFGKAGKCKVAFEQGISAKEGDKAELKL
ncbi:hypothetical protein FisN_3Hh309 [Fistulifera solaris]|uniref:Elongation factor Tu, chloroplastic n=1 Tax=Fistulifera solaris TaxID=1519565 RepID=A0A1Z5JQH3_FISSO|nr:hypothetical protein FisN_3Hh309 [Fistulifera solaris]|eukprot:GAX16209.1 hypothetical protein FisN_3Hh309 [Fistulifera solaris]